MYKSMLKRSWLSITRKTSRTIILIALLFIMANLMLATIAIQRVVAENTAHAKASLSGIVYLQPDMNKAREEAMQNPSTSPGGGFRIQVRRPHIPLSTVLGIADNPYVKDLTYQVNASANASDFEPIDQTANLPPGAGLHIGGPMGRGNISILGINAYDFISDVENGSMSITSGQAFDESSSASAIIPYDLADQNSLKVGDTITLATTAEDSKEITLTIIGIYDTTSEMTNPNLLYMNVATAADFLLADDYKDGSYSVNNIKYFLTSAEYKDAFLAETAAKYPNLEADGLLLNIDTAAYEHMAGPIESVGSFAAVILLLVVIASIVIITLIITINIKDRRYEMGVLMSLGCDKTHLLGQTLTELLLVGTVAFALSILPSTFLARAMGSGLLAQQIAKEEQSARERPTRGMMGSGGPITTQGVARGSSGGPVSFFAQPRSDVAVIDKIDITPSVNDYLPLFISGYIIIIFALIIPTANILRFQPKIILTGKE